jgi:hypothetical protein
LIENEIGFAFRAKKYGASRGDTGRPQNRQNLALMSSGGYVNAYAGCSMLIADPPC